MELKDPRIAPPDNGEREGKAEATWTYHLRAWKGQLTIIGVEREMEDG
jgi:hypothetical protein